MSRRQIVVNDDGPLFYDFRAAAAKCGISEDVLKEAVRAGRLRGKRTGVNGGGKYLFSRRQLEEWFEGLIDA